MKLCVWVVLCDILSLFPLAAFAMQIVLILFVQDFRYLTLTFLPTLQFDGGKWNLKDKSGDITYFFFIVNTSHEKAKINNGLILPASISLQSLIYLISLRSRAPMLTKIINNTSVSHIVALWLTCSFITINMDIVVYFNSTLHTPSCCKTH